MLAEPAAKRVVAFFDGQNLFHSIKGEFGYTFPKGCLAHRTHIRIHLVTRKGLRAAGLGSGVR